METKSAIVGGLGTLVAVGIAFGGFAVANANTAPSSAPVSIVATTAAPEPTQEPVVTEQPAEPVVEPAPVVESPAPVAEAPAPVVAEPAPAAPAPVYVEPAPVYVAPAPAPEPVYVAPAPAPEPVEPAPAPVVKGADGYYYAPDVPTTSGPKIGRAG